DSIHLVGQLPEPTDVRADTTPAPAPWNTRKIQVLGVIFERGSVVPLATALEEIAEHVHDGGRSRAFVQRVDVLRAEEEAISHRLFYPGERDVGGVRKDGACLRPAPG